MAVASAMATGLRSMPFIGGGNAPVELPREDKAAGDAGRSFKSRLIIGTGKYKTYADNAAALERAERRSSPCGCGG